MNKLVPTLDYYDLYFLPVKRENINAGWLDWMNNFQITKYLSAESKKYTVEDLERYLVSNESLAFLACHRKLDDAYLGNLRIYQLLPGILSFGRLIGDRRFHSLGYGTKLNNVALELCFTWFGANLVVVGHHKDNKASAVSKTKTGFSCANRRLLDEWGIDLENAVYIDKKGFLKGQF